LDPVRLRNSVSSIAKGAAIRSGESRDIVSIPRGGFERLARGSAWREFGRRDRYFLRAPGAPLLPHGRLDAQRRRYDCWPGGHSLCTPDTRPVSFRRLALLGNQDRCSAASGISNRNDAECPLSLLKNPSDHRGCSSATATVGHARKFVRSRNPVNRDRQNRESVQRR
jgi:hypothetical protein